MITSFGPKTISFRCCTLPKYDRRWLAFENCREDLSFLNAMGFGIFRRKPETPADLIDVKPDLPSAGKLETDVREEVEDLLDKSDDSDDDAEELGVVTAR